MEIKHPSDVINIIGMKRPAAMPMQVELGTLPFAALAYGMAGEDLLLRKMFKSKFAGKQAGLYVDIGCAAPTNCSNTYIFYGMGWQGICIDANATLAPGWKSLRPEDIFINAAVSDGAGETFFFRHRKNPGMSQISHIPIPPEGDFDPTAIPIPVRRLDEVFATHVQTRSIDFMTLDIEGAELGALRSNDWSRWRPAVIMMECHNFDFADAYGEPSVRFLAEQDYVLEGKISANVVMVDKRAVR